jgi:hypothetical protein
MVAGGHITGDIKQHDFNRFDSQSIAPGAGIVAVFSPAGRIILVVEPADILDMNIVA